MTILKTLVLLLTTFIGYLLGVKWIGPSFVGRPGGASAASATATGPASPSGVVATSPALSVTPVKPQSSDGDGAVAIVSDQRRHRGEENGTVSASDETGATVDSLSPRRRRKRHHLANASDSGDNQALASKHFDHNGGSAGDQTLLPEDTTHVGGADNQPAGVPGPDVTSDSATDNSAAGDNSGATSAGDPGANTTPAPRAHPRRKRRHSPTAPPPDASPDTGAAGDNSAPAPPDSSGAGTGPDQNTVSHAPAHAWTVSEPDRTPLQHPSQYTRGSRV